MLCLWFIRTPMPLSILLYNYFILQNHLYYNCIKQINDKLAMVGQVSLTLHYNQKQDKRIITDVQGGGNWSFYS